MKTAIIITGNELRHRFFRIHIGASSRLQILKTFCETSTTLEDKVRQEDESIQRSSHLLQRTQTERDFFDAFVQKANDRSNPFLIQKGEINNEDIVKEISHLNPDFIISYGCSIIKSNLLKHFQGRFINVHLGLSPYYRGSGTNFWPFVNCEPWLIGVTFMHIDEGIDTGQIIHQIRAEIFPWDNMHTIGNRLIKDSTHTCEQLVANFENLQPIPTDFFPPMTGRYYRNKDFNEQSVQRAYENLNNGILGSYLEMKQETDRKSPIYHNPGLGDGFVR